MYFNHSPFIDMFAGEIAAERTRYADRYF